MGTPPGVEFEAMMRLDDPGTTPDRHFTSLALGEVASSPFLWGRMGVRKVLTYLTFPGPGRNMELTLLMRRTGAVLLIPLSILLTALALVRFFGAVSGDLLGRLAAAMLVAAAAAAFVFIPAARYRTAFFPAVLFLSALRPPSARELPWWILVCLTITALSLTASWPGAPRDGLTEVLSAQEQLDRGKPDLALQELDAARSRGFHGADLHNIAGAALSTSDRGEEGLSEFMIALEIEPGSPTLWRNAAVALWNSGRYEDGLSAARRAVSLDPRLREELSPVLEWGEYR
jgi:tetratricopeptide (TPR) repeat protein